MNSEMMTVAVQKDNTLLLIIKHDLNSNLYVISALKLHSSKFSRLSISEIPNDNQPTIPLTLKDVPYNTKYG